MATMRDVAALAGVSAKTVSRVFNDDPHVSAATRIRVEDALRQLHYVPNAVATTFRTGRAPVIGVAVPDLVDPFFASLAEAVDALAADHDMAVVITNLGRDPEREPAVVQSLLRQAPSGLIIAPVAAAHGYLAAWADRTPVVFVDRPPVGLRADAFVEDDVAGARLATAHLIEHGHTRIAFLGDDLTLPTTGSRLAGYRAALTAAGLPGEDALIAIGAVDRDGAARTYAQLEPAAPTALFCSNARAALNLVPRLRDSGLAVVSFGDFPLADSLSPALTVIDQDPRRIGTLAAQRILDRLEHPERRYRRRTVLPVRLVERDSCRVGSRRPSRRSARSGP